MGVVSCDCDDVVVASNESALGRWTAAHWSPPRASPLSGIVERIWYFDGTMARPRERVFPDGCAELVVMLDEPHRDGDSDALLPFPAVCINGLRTRPAVVVAPPGRCRVLGIRFEPAGAPLLLRASMRELVDVTIDLRAAAGNAAAELGERCFDATSGWSSQHCAMAALNTSVAWIMHELSGNLAPDPTVHWTAQRIRNARGLVSVDEIGAALGLTRSRLAQRFRDYVGVTPKRFARITRFQGALALLGRTGGIAVAAAELGYYDQAHMYRDFAEFAGMTPGAFVAASRYPNSVSVAES